MPSRRPHPRATWAATALAAIATGVSAADPPPDYAQRIEPLLVTHCGGCHSAADPESGVALDARDPTLAGAVDRPLWQRVLRQIEGGVMPPADAPQPSAAEREEMAAWIRAALRPDCSQAERPGRVTLRRLNRAEYDNTIRDLLHVDVRAAASFPSDDIGYGFDSIGDVLSMPPVLFERALEAAEKVASATIATGDVGQAPVQTAPGGTLATAGEIAHDVEFRGSGDYVLRVQAWGDQAGDESVKMALRIDGRDVETFEVANRRRRPKDFEVRLPVESGTRRVAAAFLNDYFDPANQDPRKRDRNLHVGGFTLVGPIGSLPDPLPEPHRRFFSRTVDAQADVDQQRRQATEMLRPITSRAFRRPATREEVERLTELFMTARARGDSVERSAQLALTALLVSPQFLFRVERDPPPGEVRDLDDFEMASRLSYFLWSSMPDDTLLAAALRGELRTPEQLAAQARRMLQDPKARALVDNFAAQWLQLRSLDVVSPDTGTFKDFDDALRKAMRRETEEFFAAIVREDRSILEFLDCDSTFLNERLARHYGIEGVSGEEFRRVAVDRGTRGGLLGQASVLTVTSNPTRTSPVKRGKWILENLFAAPPPPPPPNVPDLKASKEPAAGTLRQQMERHRSDPGCAACHSLMDPLGFGLENYDAVGGWRTSEGEVPIDPAGELPGGRRFSGPAELRTILLDRKDEFRRCLAEKLLTYALGRGLEWFDACAIERIAAGTAREGDRFSALVVEIVASPAFRQREAPADR